MDAFKAIDLGGGPQGIEYKEKVQVESSGYFETGGQQGRRLQLRRLWGGGGQGCGENSRGAPAAVGASVHPPGEAGSPGNRGGQKQGPL